MILGIDYYNCITQYPGWFQWLAAMTLRDGGKVHIISGVGPKRLELTGGLDKYIEEIWAYDIPHTTIEIIEFKEPRGKDAPQLKLEKCQELGVQIFIDDRKDTVKLMHANGIMALLMPKPNQNNL